MNTEDEILLTRYLDGELTAAELESFERRLLSDNELNRSVLAQRNAGDAMRSLFAPAMPIPHADFFQSQLMRRIREESEDCSPAAAKAGSGGFWSWLSRPWMSALAGAAACAVVMLTLLPRQMPSGALASNEVTPAAGPEVATAYVPGAENGVEVNAHYLPEALATVVKIDGLPELPSDSQIGGFRFNVPTELRDRFKDTGSVSLENLNKVGLRSASLVPVAYQIQR